MAYYGTKQKRMKKPEVVTQFKGLFSDVMTKEQMAAGWKPYLLTLAVTGHITVYQCDTWKNPFE